MVTILSDYLARTADRTRSWIPVSKHGWVSRVRDGARGQSPAKSVIGGRHHGSMAEPADSLLRRRLQMTLVEARIRFAQMVRLAALTSQITIITDGGRPAAAIIPISLLPDDDAPETCAPNNAALTDGWIRRIEQVRMQSHRQRRGLEQALFAAWRELDRRQPPGTDHDLDALRISHADLRAR